MIIDDDDDDEDEDEEEFQRRPGGQIWNFLSSKTSLSRLSSIS